jgi:transposase InsO family protein
LPFSSSETPIYFPFQLVHSDVWTSPVYSHTSYKYYVVLIDAFTHYIWTFPIRNKSDVQDIIRSFFSYVHTQFRLPILTLQTDNGREFDTTAMRAFLSAHGTSFCYTSQQNGKAERILRTINDCVRTLLIHSAAPMSVWAEALYTATFLINRRPCHTTGAVTPHQLLLGSPRLQRPMRLRLPLLPNISSTTPHKLSARSVACVFLGILPIIGAIAATTSLPGVSTHLVM